MLSDLTLDNAMRLAYSLASQSPDLSTQTAAIILSRSGHILGAAANTLPRGVEITNERLSARPLKYSVTEHAERNAIYMAAKYGEPTAGATMVALWAACSDCARAIIQSGIATLVTHSFYTPHRHETHSSRMVSGTKSWGADIDIALQMLEEARVNVFFSDTRCAIKDNAGLTLRFNGQQVSY